MQTLPSSRQPTPRALAPAGSLAEPNLAQAFKSFAEAAQSLEASYGQLQTEVAQLRRELGETNRDLAQSLAENRRIRLFLSRILEGLPCGVLVLDSGGEVQIANPEARRLLGLAATDPAPTLQARVQQLADLFPDGGQAHPSDSEWEVPAAGGNVCLAVRRAVMPADEGRAHETIFILRDKSEEKLLAIEREKAQRAQALAEMAMLLAHEIRNPLASLELFAGLLADVTAKRSAARHWVEHLQAGLRALAATVNNVLQFHSQTPLQTVPTDLVRLLKATASFLEPLAGQRQMRIELTSDTSEFVLAADPHRLQQVFLNLALNAFRAMKAGGLLKLGITRDEPVGGVRIACEDQGAGIAREDLSRIFEPGFTTSPGSPGLGLAVCRRIIEQHGGSIRVESEPGRGARFILQLPAEGVGE